MVEEVFAKDAEEKGVDLSETTNGFALNHTFPEIKNQMQCAVPLKSTGTGKDCVGYKK